MYFSVNKPAEMYRIEFVVCPGQVNCTGSVITFFSESSLSLRSPSAGDLSDPKNLLHWSRQRCIDFFAANRKFDRSQKFYSTTSIIIIPRKSLYTVKYLYSFQYAWLSTEEFIIMPCSSNSNCDVVRGPH